MNGRDEPLFAFAEQVERSTHSIRARFDAISESDATRLMAVPAQVRGEVNLALPNLIVTVHGKGPGKSLLDVGAGPGGLREDRWYRLELGEDGERPVVAAIYAAPGVGDEPRVGSLRSLAPLSADLVGDLTSHHGPLSGEDLSAREVEAWLPDLAHHGDLRVMTYNVGQGDAHAVCDDRNVPLLYFDLGGGCYWNAHTYRPPHRLRFCWARRPPVVLSHFDFDHLFSATLDPASTSGDWLVPDGQPYGPSVDRLITTIRLRGSVRFWRTTGPEIAARGPVTIARPAPGEDSKNNSGIVMRVALRAPSTTAWPVLLPADCGYSYIAGSRLGLSDDLEGLVAAHHGSGRYTAVPPVAASPNSRLAYSAGRGNTYHHPKPAARRNHAAKGWHRSRDTKFRLGAQGNVVMAPTLVPLGLPVGCTCSPPCDLTPFRQ